MIIWIASRFGPTYQGGLGAYTRQVITGVQHATTAPLTVVCAMAEMESLPTATGYETFPLVELETTWFGRASKPLWNRFASRPSLHGLLETILHRAWRPPEIAKPSVTHYVGAGWELFGVGG